MTQVTSSNRPPPIKLRLNYSREESRSPVQNLRKQSSLVGLLPHEEDYRRNNPKYLLHFKRLFSEQEEKIKALSIQLQAKDARLERIERLLKVRADKKHPSYKFESEQHEQPVQPPPNPLKKASRKTDRSSYNLLRKYYMQSELPHCEQPQQRNFQTQKPLELSPLNHDASQRKIRVPLQRLRRIPKAELLRRVREASDSVPTRQ